MQKKFDTTLFGIVIIIIAISVLLFIKKSRCPYVEYSQTVEFIPGTFYKRGRKIPYRPLLLTTHGQN